MKREIKNLQERIFDVLVVGGGIYGACAAWDAAQRGLSVAIIDKVDFGHATSANSLKIIHGGLRYLQDGNLGLARTMIRERRAFMRIAPHLVHPLPCILPTTRRLTRSKAVLAAALAVNNLLGFDRNRDQPDTKKHLPAGHMLSRKAYLNIAHGVSDTNITGAALWHDAQIFSSERLTLSFIRTAVNHGATAANYLEATSFLRDRQQITGVRVRDALSGSEIDIQAKVVINATGPLFKEILDDVGARNQKAGYRSSLALNLVTRQILPDYAIGIPSRYTKVSSNGKHRENGQTLFIAPWREYSLVGTKHASTNQNDGQPEVSRKLINDMLEDINEAFPGANLKPEDVLFIHKGYLPDENNNGSPDVKLVRNSEIVDHAVDGIQGLITVIGVKYTLARQTAEQAIDLVFEKLSQPAPPCQTAQIPLYGGDIPDLEKYINQEVRKQKTLLDPLTMQHLIFNYGTAHGELAEFLGESNNAGRPDTPEAEVIRARVRHAMRYEMAMKLSDIVLRRTDLGSAGKPPDAIVRDCASIMAAEMGWSQEQINTEIEELNIYYADRTLA